MANKNITVRKYKDSDFPCVAHLFRETVTAVNCAHYTAEQICAWINGCGGLNTRSKDLSAQRTLIAEIDGVIVGFGSIDGVGCLDMLYVHKEFQHCGIAAALCDRLEKGFSAVKTYASITAKPFFEGRGYTLVQEREAERLGVRLKNYEMQKESNGVI
jgi:putative acetyltransferase